MSEIRKKTAYVFRRIFGCGILLVLFTGGATFFGYAAALCTGGETASAICVFIYKKIIPVMVYVTTGLILFGLLSMYIAGEKALDRSEEK